MKKISFYTLLLLCLVIFGMRYRYFIPAFLYEHFISYKVELPQDKNFVVRAESTNIPQYIKHIIKMAFPEYTIVYSNDIKPHLVVKNVYRARNTSIISEINNRVPYLSFSPEKGQTKLRRYRSTGYPLYEFVTFKTNKDGFAYIPFVAYAKESPNFLNSDPRPQISLVDIKKRKDLVYVYSHCVPVRDNFFIAVSKYLKSAESYGKCLNNQSGNAPGSYNDLKALYSDYKFVVAMEHQKKPGYITEKIINAYEANAIPIYWGDDKTVKEIFNDKSYIDLSSFQNYQEASEYLFKLSKNDLEIQKILAEPILTKKGEVLLSVNKKELPSETSKFLSEIAKNIRIMYFHTLNEKKIF
ncbi:MAG: hypothetical protein KBC27_00395 [Rickettsiales bacterium]|nr:hypothetical protein [Rickettsiales bacterium]